MSYALSSEADRDLEAIAGFTAETWGLAKAEDYIVGIHSTFEILARFPRLGRSVAHIRVGYFRFEHASHAIFYRTPATGILIMRVLHRRMKADDHL